MAYVCNDEFQCHIHVYVFPDDWVFDANETEVKKEHSRNTERAS